MIPPGLSDLLYGPGSHLQDLGTDRLKQMDAMGINTQVLSYAAPGTQVLSAAEAVPLARDANDQLAAAIAAHPVRFTGFANMSKAITGGGFPTDSPTFKISMREYEDMAIKVGDKITIEINKSDNSSGT